MSEPTIKAGFVGPGEYAPAGELQGIDARFTVGQVAMAFAVAQDRVVKAMAGEFGLGPKDTVDSRQAQRLSEVLLTDAPMDVREAALMTLGAYTPRADEDWGVGDVALGEEGDRFAASPFRTPDELDSPTGSHDPSQPTGRD